MGSQKLFEKNFTEQEKYLVLDELTNKSYTNYSDSFESLHDKKSLAYQLTELLIPTDLINATFLRIGGI